MTEKTQAALRNTIEELMDAGVKADLPRLQNIYHDGLKIMFLSIDGQLMEVDKHGCLGMLAQTFEGKDPSLYMWSKFHTVTVSGDRGHVLISRKLPIGGPLMMIDLSIDLVFEDDRWQVMREVNFGRLDAEAA